MSLDRLDEARAAMARLIELDPTFSLSAERRTARFGDSPLMDRYLADLEVAGAPVEAGQIAARPETKRDPMRSISRLARRPERSLR